MSEAPDIQDDVCADPAALLPPAERELSLTELVAWAARAEARLPAPADGRVGGVDVRSVRYYQTLGLLERPLRYDGRSAVYGRAHVVTLVCVRALQVRGRTLAQIQRALATTPPALREAAALEALGAAPAASANATPPVAPGGDAGPRPLLAFALAPGVHITLDPTLVRDPATLVAALAAVVSAHPVVSAHLDATQEPTP